MFSALLSMALLIAPQVNPANPRASATAEQKCTVSGSVLSAATGQPLRDAAVTLRQVGAQGSTPRSVATDAGGHFEFKNLDPGRYFLNARHAGYVAVQYGQKDPGSPGGILTLRPGQSARNVSFQLLREAVITGHVYSEDGEPLEHIQVRALRYRYLEGKRRLLAGGFGMTDDRGQYRIFDLPPGRYYVSASSQSMGSETPFTYGPSYYPGVADASQASPVTLRAGDEFPNIDLTLQRAGTFHIRGQVVSSNSDAQLTSAFVQIITSGPFANFGMGNRVRDAQGDFVLSNVRAGSYDLVARLTIGGKPYQAQQRITVMDSDVNGIRLVLTQGATLKGAIRTDGEVDFSKVHIFLRPRIRVYFGSYGDGTVSSDGTFECDGIPDGGYRIRVFGLPQNAYVKSATLGGEDVLNSGFEIMDGQAPGSELRILVSTDGGRVGGTVMLDGKPFNHALVTLLPDDSAKLSSDLWFKSAATDQYGRFTLAGIRPGDYRLFAWEKIEQGEERDPSFYSQIKDDGQEVHVGPGAVLNYQLNAISARETQAAEGQ